MASHKRDPLLGTRQASCILGVSTTTIRQLATTGVLVPDERTPDGVRFFRQSTIEKVAARRRKQHAQSVGKNGRPIKLPPDEPYKPWELDNDK